MTFIFRWRSYSVKRLLQNGPSLMLLGEWFVDFRLWGSNKVEPTTNEELSFSFTGAILKKKHQKGFWLFREDELQLCKLVQLQNSALSASTLLGPVSPWPQARPPGGAESLLKCSSDCLRETPWLPRDSSGLQKLLGAQRRKPHFQPQLPGPTIVGLAHC